MPFSFFKMQKYLKHHFVKGGIRGEIPSDPVTTEQEAAPVTEPVTETKKTTKTKTPVKSKKPAAGKGKKVTGATKKKSKATVGVH